MAAPVVQQLRTTAAGKLPPSLEPGQVAFNLHATSTWMFVGTGAADITVDGSPLAYGTTATVLGVAGVAVPAKPGTGKGYAIYHLVGNPASAGKVLTITDDLVNAETTPATTSAKIIAALVKANKISAAGDLHSGDSVILTAGTGSPFPGIGLGPYSWDGSAFVLASSQSLLHTLADVDDSGLAGAVTTLPAAAGTMTTAADGATVVMPTGGSGTGLAIEVSVASNVFSYTVVNPGAGYADADVVTVAQADVPGANADETFTLAPANIGRNVGLLVRDATIADGQPGAWKAQTLIDLGSF